MSASNDAAGRVEAKVGLDVIGIVVEYLDREGFDGLYNSDGGCACKTGELAPCGEITLDCTAGYLQPCPDTCQEHDWHIGKERPNEPVQPASCRGTRR